VVFAIILVINESIGRWRPWWHALPVALADLFLLGVLYFIDANLGVELVMIWRNLVSELPSGLWLGEPGWRSAHCLATGNAGRWSSLDWQ
jgi:hypothetical protein